MATLPRASKITPTVASSALFQRTVSEFDAGINTSAAWTTHIESGSLSDEEPDHGHEQESLRSGRALYDFDGKAEFRELSVEAGDEIEVVKETLADGWSLVKNTSGEIGLLPRSYYTFTSDFKPAPDLEVTPLPSSTHKHGKEASTDSITPRGSPKPQAEPLVPQNTGEWRNAFPSFRRSLLGGKSLNRFSSFVTSGAEEFVLKGSPAETLVTTSSDSTSYYTAPTSNSSHNRDATNATFDEEESNRLSRMGLGEADRHFVDAGPAWKEKIPPFRVLVHSPSKRTSVLSGAFTIYSVTSLFHLPSISEEDEDDAADAGLTSPTRLTVYRRFSHFVLLHTALSRRLPGIALPPLPEKQYAGRFSEDFVEARRGDLERYITKIIRHPVARYAEVVTFFLGCESDTEWKRLAPYHLSMPAAGSAFYARVFHPAFNLDAEDAEEAFDRFDVHTRAVGKGVQGLRNIFGRIREARIGKPFQPKYNEPPANVRQIEMSKAERLLSYSLLSLITTKPLASAPMTGVSEDDNYDIKSRGLINEDGAWCWREGCQDCLKLTKAMQKTSETLQGVADLYDDHARRTLLATHESLKGMAHPSSLYEPIITTHKSTLSRYKDATKDGQAQADDEMAARCETVLNTTMAEMETYHTQKLEDFRELTKEHLDGEIEFYAQILNRLTAARRAFDPPTFDMLADSPRQPSMYERELEHPRLTPAPLLQPCPHVFDSAPMRPVSAAIQDGVGLLLGPAAGRGSVFGNLFW
ncbi:hypothetical protein H0H81_006680 [Sphagnurus paluster]|uniref:PX-domain-containing protein n=1 Tax=Sphagnurus paluster TaxID=117069 RepID=A0A9P7K6H5_9AGAR|nr:hypothetical protein H0H81_006680 [Sphagnurus paluster]